VKAHNNSPLVVHIDVGGTRIAQTKVLKKHAEIESFLGSLRSRDVLAFLRAWERSAAEFDLPWTGCAVPEEDVVSSAAVAVRVNNNNNNNNGRRTSRNPKNSRVPARGLVSCVP
jgi:hypothetical protein